MKKNTLTLSVLYGFVILFFSLFASAANGAATVELPKFCRGVWVSTVGNIDFPSKPGIPIEQMKSEIDAYLNTAEKLGLNMIFLQVRPMGDAMYASKIYPWSGFLTGRQGQAPADDFDPLKYWINGAHKREIQLHAWCNPYRVTSGPRIKREDLAPTNPAVLHPEWTFEKDGKIYLDPGIPEVRQLVTDGLVEIVSNYDVDGVHFDDYFYPARKMEEDAETFKKYGQGYDNIEDWRRNNVDLLVKGIREAVKKANPKAAWGISPAGIWGNQPAHSDGSATRGNSTYDNHFADTKKWLKDGWVDYLVPQIYWHIGFDIADFKTLVDWWDQVAAQSDSKLYIGMAAYRVNSNSRTEAWKTPEELVRQFDYLKTKDNTDGFVLFTMHDLNPGTEVNKTLSAYFAGVKPSSDAKVTVKADEKAVAQKGRNLKVNKKSYIYISPSSQNRNIGYGEYLSEEYRMNQFAQHLKKYLLDAGVTVLPDLPAVTKKQLDDPNFDRPSLRSRLDQSMSMAKEIEKNEPNAPFYHVALHTNAFRGQTRGVEIFIDPANPKSVAMGTAILEAVVAVYHEDNPEEAETHTTPNAKKYCRGVKDTGRLIEAQGVNTKNGMLIEMGFHDHKVDSQWMMDCIAEGDKENGVNHVAKAMADAIVEHINAQE